MSVPSDEPAAKRRKVRKGTHSCWECRRRKVKCTFSSLDDAICITCLRRGTKCISQVILDGLETGKSDTGDAGQDAAIDIRIVGESGVRSQPELLLPVHHRLPLEHMQHRHRQYIAKLVSIFTYTAIH